MAAGLMPRRREEARWRKGKKKRGALKVNRTIN